MGLLIILLVGFYLFWVLLIRRSYFGMKYKKDKDGIAFRDGLSNEDLMSLVKEKLSYPDLKEMHYNQNGEVELVCKYGRHILSLEGKRLYVSRDGENIGTPSFKEMRNMEEAECLKVYLQKVYDPNCNINPYNKYKKLKNYNKHKIGVTVALILACIFGVVSALDESGIKDESVSQGISTGYLTDYSSEATVGDAFSNFFAEPEWVSYEQGATQYVDFKGKCSFQGDDNAVAIVTFIVSGDNFQVYKITINGQDIGVINQNAFLQTVYGISTSLSNETTNETTTSKQEETTTVDSNNAGTDNNFAETSSINEAMNGFYDAYVNGINEALTSSETLEAYTTGASEALNDVDGIYQTSDTDTIYAKLYIEISNAGQVHAIVIANQDEPEVVFDQYLDTVASNYYECIAEEGYKIDIDTSLTPESITVTQEGDIPETAYNLNNVFYRVEE